MKFSEITIKLPKLNLLSEKNALLKLTFLLIIISISCFIFYLNNGIGLSYNDARSHLDIGRRVVEGLKPGFAQLGSVWLPLPHFLMIPTIWIDFMWHSGLSGALVSMISFVGTGILIYQFLKQLGVKVFGRIFGVAIFVLNLNILYLQSTAMTELLLIVTMSAGAYYFMLWAKYDTILALIKSAFWIMLSTLVRYDGWFLIFASTLLLFVVSLFKKGYKTAEGKVLFFVTLGGFGILLWLVWNLIIFKDPLYFIFGEFSARAQQTQLEAAGNLATKGNLFLSIKIYLYAFMYNSYTSIAIMGAIGSIFIWFDKKLSREVKLACSLLLAPFMFNVLALYMGHSVLFIQGLSGNTWFNVRYGIMLAPSIAIYSGYLTDKLKDFRYVFVGLTMFVLLIAFLNRDAVTIDDAKFGSSQKNVSEVSGWLNANTKNKEGFILISAASHDAIIFSSGLPMSRFIHEGTGTYWESATTSPDRWARWLVMRTNDVNDLTFRLIKDSPGFSHYDLVDSYPFADIYQLKEEYLDNLEYKSKQEIKEKGL